MIFWSRMCLTVGAWKTEHFCCCCYYFYGSPQLPSSSTFALFSRYVSSHFYDSDDEDPGKKQLLKYVDLWKLVSSCSVCCFCRESQRFIDALETKMKKTWLLQSTRKHHLPSAASSSPPSSTGPKLRLINEANQFCQSDSDFHCFLLPLLDKKSFQHQNLKL